MEDARIKKKFVLYIKCILCIRKKGVLVSIKKKKRKLF